MLGFVWPGLVTITLRHFEGQKDQTCPFKDGDVMMT